MVTNRWLKGLRDPNANTPRAQKLAGRHCVELDVAVANSHAAETWASRNFSGTSQERRDGKALHKNGKGDNSETDGNDLFAMRNGGGQAQGQSERYRTPQAAPKKNVLVLHRNLKSSFGEKKRTGIDRGSPAQSYQGNRYQGSAPGGKILMCFMNADQQENQ